MCSCSKRFQQTEQQRPPEYNYANILFFSFSLSQLYIKHALKSKKSDVKCNFSYINLVTFESLFNDKRQNYLTLVCRLLKSIYYCVRKRKQAVYHPSSRRHSIGAVWCPLAVVLAIKVTTPLSSSKLEAKKWWLESFIEKETKVVKITEYGGSFSAQGLLT